MKLDELVNKYHNTLNSNDMYIWQFILNHKDVCFKYTIDEFADHCNVSKATLFRFAKKLSLNGFSELKSRLKLEHDEKEEICCLDYLETVCECYHKLIDDMKKRDCNSIFQLMENANRIFIYGSGNAQKAVADEIKRIFLSIKKCFYVITGDDTTNSLVHVATENDLMIIVSLSGESPVVVNMARKLNMKNVPMISITRLKNNELALLSDENLYINTTSLNIDSVLNYETTTPYFILIEILFLKYQLYLSGV
ncbi:RpiR family transcriptional regulator [Clostridium polyendosporum]|uniref:RpiR family transcriptional regulator n=1 Tax=Clostridium polyendosporum TaxID=69208 RepID=A0A919VHN1_9CLOT|nr:MurR/RpiR family transcriptional regulator [Clostridium polyendosporum]GIM30422.1 RpiR family transcriptional regulator [Clostridium polyendosporum]